MVNKEQVHIHIVSSSDTKEQTFGALGWNISRRLPSFDEAEIHKRAPTDEHRAEYIAEQKALEDGAYVAALCGWADLLTLNPERIEKEHIDISLYTDTVQVIQGIEKTNYEKPETDALSWAKESPDALVQSGKNVEIRSALAAIACTNDGITSPEVVRVSVLASMKPFTREDIVLYAQTSTGKRSIEDTAGGISLANGGRKFYDMDKPLTVVVSDKGGIHPHIVHHYDSWHELSDEELRPYITGAFEPALSRVIEKTIGKKVL